MRPAAAHALSLWRRLTRVSSAVASQDQDSNDEDSNNAQEERIHLTRVAIIQSGRIGRRGWCFSSGYIGPSPLAPIYCAFHLLAKRGQYACVPVIERKLKRRLYCVPFALSREERTGTRIARGVLNTRQFPQFCSLSPAAKAKPEPIGPGFARKHSLVTLGILLQVPITRANIGLSADRRGRHAGKDSK